MKKAYLLLIITMLGSLAIRAQEFNAAVYSGIIASQIDGDTHGGYNKAGLLAGGYINRYFNKKWAWQMGLRYAQKGSKGDNDDLGIHYKAQLHYMEMPLTIRYQHFKMVDLEAGISFGYLIKALEAKDGIELLEANPPFKKYEAALVAGLSYHFNEKWAVGTHYSYSILAVRPYSSGNERFMDKGQYNNVITFELAYKLSSWR